MMVALRDVQPEDSERIRLWRNSPEVAEYMYTDHVITPEEHAAWFVRMMADDSSRYWIITLDGEPVGLIGLYDIKPQHRRCAWGFYIGEPDARGQGIASYAWYRTLSYVFDTLGFNKLCADAFSDNEASLNMHDKYGFRQEGYFRQHVIKHGAPRDVIALGLLREEWEQVKPEMETHLRDRGLIE